MDTMSWHQPQESEIRSCTSYSSQQSLPLIPSLNYVHPEGLQPVSANIYHHCMTTLKGHSSYVSSLALAGNLLFSGSSDKQIRSWKCDGLSFSHDEQYISDNVVANGKGAVKAMVILSDKLFTAHQDHKIRVWKIDSDENHNGKYQRLAKLPTLSDRAYNLLIPSSHVQIRRHKKSTWVHHVDTVSALALSKDGNILYSVSWDRSLKVWRTSDFKCLESVANAHDDAINAVESSSDGSVITGSADRKIKVWRKHPGEKKHSLVGTLEKHNSGINALATSIDGSVLFSGASDRSIVVWEKDGDNMTVVGALRGHTKAILCLAVVAELVCSGSADKTIRIWQAYDRSYSCLAVLEGHSGPVKCLAASISHTNPSNSICLSSYLVYSGSLDCDIKVWQVCIPHFLDLFN
uniref:Uncharacterized protein n=1 Tax=Kalanchoe fedtschenkoi TaxID=63787 RepID=A0A7N0U3Y8_KALFE